MANDLRASCKLANVNGLGRERKMPQLPTVVDPRTMVIHAVHTPATLLPRVAGHDRGVGPRVSDRVSFLLEIDEDLCRGQVQ